MGTIKIKFKDTLTLTKFDININFKSNNKNYTNINTYKYPSGFALNYGSYTACFPGNSWTDKNNKYIEIDPTQTNFNTFVTAMKDNIDGVELEAGTYKWVDNPSLTNVEVFTTCDFMSNNIGIETIGVYSSKGGYIQYALNIGGDITVYHGGGVWENEEYKTLSSGISQYINFDFYNYAILGNQLVKQGGSGGTNKLKFGTETPTKLYIGETEVTKAYMGETLVYEK